MLSFASHINSLNVNAFCGIFVEYWEPYGSPQLLFECTQNSAVFAVEVVCSALSTQKTLSLFYCSRDSCKAIVEKTMEKKKKRQSAVCIVFCHSDTLQSPCSGGYDLWTRLHVVRTWAGSLTSPRREMGESSLLCPWCSFYTPILALLISVSVYSFDGL